MRLVMGRESDRVLRRRLQVVVASLALAGGLSLAQADDEPQVDCENPMTQFDMNVCSDRDYREADASLNAQWAVTKNVVKEWDESLKSLGLIAKAEQSLLKSQRAWIQYRDGQCETEEAGVQGGSMAPMVYSSCLADLTRKRTEELKSLAENS
ncbi:MAG: lysozyme inhibitor LprI family protein [Allorhizobium sp.]